MKISEATKQALDAVRRSLQEAEGDESSVLEAFVEAIGAELDG